MHQLSRSLTAVLAAIAMLLSGLPTPAASAAGARMMYVDASAGDDANSGATPSKAVRSLGEAITNLADDGGRIVLTTDYPIAANYTEPKHTGEILITSRGADRHYPGRLVFTGGDFTTYNLSGPVRLADLTISMSAWAIFAAHFNPIAFDHGVQMVNTASPTSRKLFVLGGYESPPSHDLPTDGDSHITINSGTFYKVAGFSRSRGVGTQTYTGTSHLTVNGGSIQEIFGASLENHYSGSTEIRVTGGKIGTLNTAGDVTRYLFGTAKVELNGGTIDKININNVVKDVDLTLAGATFGDIQASNAFASQSTDDLVQATAAVRTVHYAAQYYSRSQLDKLKAIFDEAVNTAQVYVQTNATGATCTVHDPCGSLNTAVGLLRSDGGTVVVHGPLPWDVDASTLADGEGRIVFTGDRSARIVFDQDAVLRTGRDLTFGAVELANRGTLVMQADGSDLVIDRGARTSEPAGTTLMGVSDGSSVTVRDGSFAKVIGAGDLSDDFDGTATVTVAGGTVQDLWAGSDQPHNVARSLTTVSGGTVGTVHSSAGRITKSMSVRLLGGSIKQVELDRIDADATLRLGATTVGEISGADWTEAPEATRSLIQLPGANKDTVDAIKHLFGDVVLNRYVYLAQGGTGDGTSPDQPAGDLNQAISALRGTGYVVVTGRYAIQTDYQVAEHARRVVLTSDDGDRDFRANGARIELAADLRLGGETVIEHIALASPATDGTIHAMGHPLTIGEDVKTELTRRSRSYIGLVGGRHDARPAPSVALVVNSGEWGALRGGTDNSEARTTGVHTAIAINGGTFHGPVALGHRGEAAGSITMDVNGGTFIQGIYAAYEEDGKSYSADYDVDITVNGGEFWSMVAPAKSRSTVLAGSFDVQLTGGDFSHLTDIRGTKGYGGSMTSSLHIDPAMDLDQRPQGTITFTNYLLRAADPYLFTHQGQYYLTATADRSISLHKVANVPDLKQSVGSVIFTPKVGQNLWSPEIHHLSAEEVGPEYAGWYLYLSMDDGTTAHQRQYVVKALDGDDLLGRWGNPITGEVNVPVPLTNVDDPDFNQGRFVAGTSIMRVAGGTYITYVAEDGRGTADFHQTINLSHIVNPWTLSGKPTVLTKSEYDWEMHGYGQSSSDPNLWYPKVVEGGTAVYGTNGEVYLAYAASGYWTIYYSIGFLRYTGGDPFNATNWVKNPKPILSRSSTVNGIGTGPTFTDHDGNAWICYQARIGTTTASGRFAFVEPYHAGATALSIGDGTGHPASLQKTYTVNVNPVPLRAKIGGFDRTT